MSKTHPYIAVWGKMMGSFDYFVRHSEELAVKDNAPANAIHYTEKEDGGRIWSTTDDILASNTRARFENVCETLGLDSPWANQSAF